MDKTGSSPLATDFAASLDWWREAGVDCLFDDEPVHWLEAPAPAPSSAEPSRPQEASPAARKVAAPPPPPPQIGGDTASWPADTEGFRHWWLNEPSLDLGGSGPRIAARGRVGAPTMILVPMPEQEDSESLLSGPQGALLGSFLGKAGVAGEDVYLAAALPRHMPHPPWPDLHRAGLGAILLHHIGLAQPQRVLLLGNHIPPLFGHDPAQNPAFSLNLNHGGGSVRALAARSLEHMLSIPSARTRFWRDWQNWTDG